MSAFCVLVFCPVHMEYLVTHRKLIFDMLYFFFFQLKSCALFFLTLDYRCLFLIL